MAIIKASVIQTCTAAYDIDATLDKAERLVRVAKERDGSQFVVFPEATFGGYPKASGFDTVIGYRTEAGRNEYLRYHNAAIVVDPPGPALQRLEKIAKDFEVFIVAGIIEKDANGGTLYCTAVFIDPEHGYVNKHRKIMPTAGERLVWGYGDATTLPVVEAPLKKNGGPTINVRTSATICWENYVPLLRTYYYSQRTQLYCAPTVDDREEWQSTMKHIALEGRQFVLAACQFAQQKDYPDNHPIPHGKERDPEGIMIAGGSVIISPLGKVLAGPLRGEEGVLTAELDLDDIVKGHMDFDPVGHYHRGDIFELKVKGLPEKSND